MFPQQQWQCQHTTMYHYTNLRLCVSILFDHLHNYTLFQQDSAKAHTTNNSMPCLDRFATRIVRRGLWPPHFLDLNLRDFYLLGMWAMCILVTVTKKIIWRERHSTYEVIWWCSHINVVRETQQCAVYWVMSQKHWNGNRIVSLCLLNCMSLSKI